MPIAASLDLSSISSAVARATGSPCALVADGGATAVAGGSAVAVSDSETGARYFLKTGSARALHMEFSGVRALERTGTIRVPKAIASSSPADTAGGFVVFEHLPLAGPGPGCYERLGADLARLHQADVGRSFGFPIDGTCGSSKQVNTPMTENYKEFYLENRVDFMFELCDGLGYGEGKVGDVREKIGRVIGERDVRPSLLHGDLWSGNKG